jgi:hypothetical protein
MKTLTDEMGHTLLPHLFIRVRPNWFWNFSKNSKFVKVSQSETGKKSLVALKKLQSLRKKSIYFEVFNSK